jgi:hypothetical protein
MYFQRSDSRSSPSGSGGPARMASARFHVAGSHPPSAPPRDAIDAAIAAATASFPTYFVTCFMKLRAPPAAW